MVSEDPAYAVSCGFSGVVLVKPPTDRIVTAANRDEYRLDTPGFPAYSQLHSPTSPLGGAAPLCLPRGFLP